MLRSRGLFGSGQLPALITGFDSQSQVAKKADKWVDETLKWYRMSDGKTYGYTS